MRTERQSSGCTCPKYLGLLSEVARLEGEIERLKAENARLRREMGRAVRDAREAPFAENTPSSKLNFKKDSDEGAKARQGGARPGHEGHGRAKVAAEDTDERTAAETGRKSDVRDFLFPRLMPKRRPGMPSAA